MVETEPSPPLEEHLSAAGDIEPTIEPPPPPDVELLVDGFGFMPSERLKAEDRSSTASSSNVNIVRRYTWKTKNRMTVQVITYGATFTSIQVPDKKGNPDDVIAGFDTLEEYFSKSNPYFGATIGRYANYICDGTMVVNPSGRIYMLSQNRGHHHYHGGNIGFDKVNWKSYVKGNTVIMSHVSERFNEGYPGTLMTQITFDVACDNTIKIEMKCTTSEPTIVNLSQCLFFNMAGHHAGKEQVHDHIITINADKYTPTADDGIVTGEKKVVGGTALDFRVPRLLKAMLPKVILGGYDVNYCVTKGVEQDLAFLARAVHPRTGRVVEVYSNQPGLSFYTGNLLPDPDKMVETPLPSSPAPEDDDKSSSGLSLEEGGESGVDIFEEEHELEDQGKPIDYYVPLPGKQGTFYKKHGLFSLMPQNYPDAVNHKNFPSSVLNPGEVYIHRIQYKFGLLLGSYF